MRYVPGSHLERTLYPHDTDDDDAYTLNQKIRASEAAESNGRDVELLRGMFSIHDVFLIHGSNRNDSGHRRGGLALRYMPATSLYDRDLARRQVRDLGVVDISDRRLHLVRGRDHAGNDLHQAGE
jgi:ectoine hydroxylase-related dioxygenase (phytanoyl-CoA dioxygenase family)